MNSRMEIHVRPLLLPLVEKVENAEKAGATDGPKDEWEVDLWLFDEYTGIGMVLVEMVVRGGPQTQDLVLRLLNAARSVMVVNESPERGLNLPE